MRTVSLGLKSQPTDPFLFQHASETTNTVYLESKIGVVEVSIVDDGWVEHLEKNFLIR